jgi:hydrogenase expression/formation protein HypE
VTDQGEMLAEQLQQQKIPAAVIGFLSADNDRVIVNGEERRFLEPANTDAIYRME